MAISKKNRRKIVYQDKTFFWKVEPTIGEDSKMLLVSIVSESKKFNVKYFAIQDNPKNKFEITILQKQSLKNKSNHTTIICPQLIDLDKKNFISPIDIISILDWINSNLK